MQARFGKDWLVLVCFEKLAYFWVEPLAKSIPSHRRRFRDVEQPQRKRDDKTNFWILLVRHSRGD